MDLTVFGATQLFVDVFDDRRHQYIVILLDLFKCHMCYFSQEMQGKRFNGTLDLQDPMPPDLRHWMPLRIKEWAMCP